MSEKSSMLLVELICHPVLNELEKSDANGQTKAQSAGFDPNMKEYTLDEVSEHNNQDDAWIALEGLVYDITDFLEDPSQHPGGIILILENLGKDITTIFHDADVHAHSAKAIEQLKLYHIGSLKS